MLALVLVLLLVFVVNFVIMFVFCLFGVIAFHTFRIHCLCISCHINIEDNAYIRFWGCGLVVCAIFRFVFRTLFISTKKCHGMKNFEANVSLKMYHLVWKLIFLPTLHSLIFRTDSEYIKNLKLWAVVQKL